MSDPPSRRFDLEHLPSLQLPALSRLRDQLDHLVRGRLWAKVLIAMALGVLVGFGLGPEAGWVAPSLSNTLTNWLALPGQLFLVLVQMIVVPLVVASVIRGLSASDDAAELRRVGGRAIAFFAATTAMATLLGIAITTLLAPGELVSSQRAQAMVGAADTAAPVARDLPSLGSLPTVLVDILPTNPLASMVGGEMLQVILFAVVFGVALVSLPPERSAPLFDLLGSIQEVCMAVVRGAMRLAPLAVFGLMVKLTARVGMDVLVALAGYAGTVVLALSCLMVLLVLIAWVLGGVSPLRFLGASRDVLLLAFSTSSSAAVMPLSIATAEEKLGVRSSVARLLIPLGATVNMNGTALYQGCATVFLAQVFDVPLDLASITLVVVTATAASIGSPATPGVGIVVLATVLSSVGIPPAGIALIIGVDRILDMCRTVVNVAGDLVAAVVIGGERHVAARGAQAQVAT